MSRSIESRLRKLEAHAPPGRTRVLVSAFPLPDNPAERAAAVDALLASGEAILQEGILGLARPMTTEEWVAKCVPEQFRPDFAMGASWR
jgi:hypothetical protein